MALRTAVRVGIAAAGVTVVTAWGMSLRAAPADVAKVGSLRFSGVKDEG